MMRSAFLLTPFVVDVVLKILARTNPDAIGRFSFSTSVGTIGLTPSVNSVLAFSLPVPNAWIWPVGWVIVIMLIRSLAHNNGCRAQSQKMAVEKLENGYGNKKIESEVSTNFTFPFSITNFHFQNSYFLKRIPQRQFALLMLLCGAISNLVDRTFLGGVTDYLSFTNLFPAFNVADLLIIGGIIAWVHRGKERRLT